MIADKLTAEGRRLRSRTGSMCSKYSSTRSGMTCLPGGRGVCMPMRELVLFIGTVKVACSQ